MFSNELKLMNMRARLNTLMQKDPVGNKRIINKLKRRIENMAN